jgi:hypothetical protein
MLLCMVYRSQQAGSTRGSKTPMRGGHSYLQLDDILPPTGEDMIDDIGADSDDLGMTRRPNGRSFPMTKTRFLMFER